MADLIDRQAAIDALYHVDEYNARSVKAIRDLPSAQPEIIRCKDYKQFRRWIDIDICFCDITESERSDNDFCSRAERSESDG